MMKQTLNALAMLSRAYKSVFRHAYVKGLTTGIIITLMGGGAALANTPDEIEDGQYDYIITNNEDYSSFATTQVISSENSLIITNDGVTVQDADGNNVAVDLSGSFYLDGNQNHFIYNQAADGATQIGSVTTRAQQVLTSSGAGSITGNYIKNSGAELVIGELTLENEALDATDRSNISTLIDAVEAIAGGTSYSDWPSLFSAAGWLLTGAYLNMTTLEFRSSEGTAAADQTIRVGTANVNRYSVLRVIDSTADGEATTYSTSAIFGTVNLENLSAAGLGVGGSGSTAPDYVQIDELNALQGGNTFGYTGILSDKGQTVHVGTINIDSNTLDLSGHAATLAVNDILSSDMLSTTIAEYLKKFAGSVDLALSEGEALQKIGYALLSEYWSYVSSYLEKADSALGTITGVTLAGIDGQDVTVNMTYTEGSAYGPELVLGDIADGTAINVSFDQAALEYDNYQDGESAIVLYGNVELATGTDEEGNATGTYSKTDSDFTLTLNYNQGYSDEADLADKLDALASKVTNPVADLAYKVENSALPYNQNGISIADFSDNIKLRLGAYGLYDTVIADVEQGDAGGTYAVKSGSVKHLNDNNAKEALLDPSVYTAMMWRVQMSNLESRLGDLRMSNAQDGLWVRLYGGHHEFDDRNMDGNYFGVQAGFDRKAGCGWTVGAALSYTDGEIDYSDGSSDSYAYDLSLYGTFLSESGAYVDIIGKIGRISNDSTMHLHVGDDRVYASGDYDAAAYSLSAEFGWKFDVNELFFIEPQAQLSWGHVNSDTVNFGRYTAHYDDIDMLIGRIGVRTGFTLPDDMGSVYLRVNGLKDFCGDVDGTLSYSDSYVSQTTSSKEEMDDAWFEAGLGASLKFSDVFYIYAECTYAGGGDIDSVYGHAGVRFLF